MVQTPGNVRSKDAVLGGQEKILQVTVNMADAQVGTIPVFVVPAGETYRVVSARTMVTIAIAGSTTTTLKITDGSADIVSAVTFAGGQVAVGSAKVLTILTTTDILTYGDTLSIVNTAGSASAGKVSVRMVLERVMNNM